MSLLPRPSQVRSVATRLPSRLDRRRGRRWLGGLAATVLLLTTGCGGDDNSDSDAQDDNTPSAEATASPTPDAGESSAAPSPDTGVAACEEVWVAGATLPAKYKGCDKDGATIKAAKNPCSFGGAIVTYDGRFYAVLGKVVNEVPDLKTSDQYKSALLACQA